MHITARQAAEMSRATADGFTARASAFLKDRYPALAGQAGDDRLMQFVEHGRKRAQLHGFTSERDIVQYLLVMVHLGPKFDEDPRRAAVMAPFLDPASSMRPQMRLNVLLQAAAAQEQRTQEKLHADQ